MTKPDQIKVLDNDSILNQLNLILDKIEELDSRIDGASDKSSEEKQAAWYN